MWGSQEEHQYRTCTGFKRGEREKAFAFVKAHFASPGVHTQDVLMAVLDIHIAMLIFTNVFIWVEFEELNTEQTVQLLLSPVPLFGLLLFDNPSLATF